MAILKLRDKNGNIIEVPSIKGDTGPQGPAGPQGYSPIKRVDYWTDDDKQEILEELEDTLDPLEKNVDELTEKAKWIKTYDFHHLSGERFDENNLPTVIYYEPIDKSRFTLIDNKPVYDFENVRFTTSATHEDEEGNIEDNIRFTTLYSYIDEWNNVRYTFNENYRPHKHPDNTQGQAVILTDSSPGTILYDIKLEALFKPGTSSVFTHGNGKFSILSGDNVVVDGDGATASGQWNMALGNHTSVSGQSNIVRSKTATAFGYGNIVTGIHSAAINEGNTVTGYASFGWGDHNVIIGEHSTSGGWRNTVYAPYSFVNGVQNIADGEHIAGFGFKNIYLGQYNLGNGSKNTINGTYNITNGYNNGITGDYITLNGTSNNINSYYSSIVGQSNRIGLLDDGTKLENVHSWFVIGNGNQVITPKSQRGIICGYGNIVSGTGSTGYNLIVGQNNQVNSRFGVTFGEGNIVEGFAGTQLVTGRYNVKDGSAQFIVGNGTDNNNRKNIFVVNKDGRAVLGADPVGKMDAVTKQYADTIASKCEKLETALDEKEDKYINSPKNLFNASVIDQDGLYGSDGAISFSIYVDGEYIGDSITTEVPFSTICPEAVIGKTYTLSYKGGEGDLRDATITPSGTFKLTTEIYNSGITITSALADDGAAGQPSGAYFYDIMLNEGSGALPYEPFSITKDLHGQLEYLEEKIDSNSNGKLDKVTTAGSSRVYGIGSSGYQTIYTLTPVANAYTLAYRTEGGTLNVGRATTGTNAVQLAQMNEALADKASAKSVETLIKKVANIEAGTAADAFIVDDSTAYVKTIPTDVAPYAELLAVKGMTYLPDGMDADLSILVEDNNNYDIGIDAINGIIRVGVPPTLTTYYTTAPFSSIFKDAEIGKTYMLTYTVSGSTGGFMDIGKWPNRPNLNVPFTLTSDIYDNSIEFYNSEIDTEAGLYADTAYFSNIKLTEIGSTTRYTKVTEIVSRDTSGNIIGTLHIPTEVQALDGYGESGYYIAWDEDGKSWWYTPDSRTDISTYFTEDNLIPVEGGGAITAFNAEGLPTPFTIVYQKKDIRSVTSFETWSITLDDGSVIEKEVLTL